MNPFAWIGPALRVVGEYLGWINKRTELNNTPEMKTADAAQKSTTLNDQIEKEKQSHNEEAIRNRLSR